jgi:hypothetical protein
MAIGNKTSASNVTQQPQLSPFDAFFTTHNLLIMGIFGAGLVFVTLLLGYICSIIKTKIVSKRQLNCNKKEHYDDVEQGDIHYEEISSVVVLSNQRFSYSSLRRHSTDMRDEGFGTSDENEMENLEETEEQGYENSAITTSTITFPVSDPVDQELYTSHRSADLEGYQLPHSSSAGMSGGSIGAGFRAVKATPGDDRNIYLTVLPN